MKLNTKTTAALLGVSVAILLVGSQLGLELTEEKPEKVDNATSGVAATKSLDFQGKRNKVKISDGKIQLDTYTVVEEELIANGVSLAGATSQGVYITRQGGKTVRYSDGSLEEVDFNSQYGSVTGDFSYPGPNVIYADSERNAYVRNLETGEEKQLASNVLEVVADDADGNGVPESAEIRLMNGSKMIKSPVNSTARSDWDRDGLVERIYTKGTTLYSQDRKHGEEKLTEADEFEVRDKRIYVSHDGKIRELKFSQRYYNTGTYTSTPTEFSNVTRIRQFISEADLNGGSIEAKLMASGENRSFSLSEGFTDKRFNITSRQVKIRFTLHKKSGKEKTPILNNYRLLVRKGV
ncbi:MAG: hypothetical protein ABEJ03_00885 [Candidatus Nanohaloarchaea archaeon]